MKLLIQFIYIENDGDITLSKGKKISDERSTKQKNKETENAQPSKETDFIKTKHVTTATASSTKRRPINADIAIEPHEFDRATQDDIETYSTRSMTAATKGKYTKQFLETNGKTTSKYNFRDAGKLIFVIT